MQSFTVLCAKFHTVLCKEIATVNSSRKLILNYKIFSTKLHSHEMFGSREFKNIFDVCAKKVSAVPCAKLPFRCST